MNVVRSTRAVQVILKKTQLAARRPGMWPSSLIHREAGQHGKVANDVISDNFHFDVKNPTAYSIAWSREASFNTIPAIVVTKYTWRH